jgi:antitoxin (DNA-binding transcriptional repressor) of toxin-antitoxin stability system
MTAAFAYELPPHSPVPVDAVESVEGGEVVSLFRAGRLFATIVPVREEIRRLEEAVLVADQVEQKAVADFRASRDIVEASALGSEQKQLLIDHLEAGVEAAEENAEAAHARLALARKDAGEEFIPGDRVWAELGL